MKKSSHRFSEKDMKTRTSLLMRIVWLSGLILATAAGARLVSAADVPGPIAARYNNDLGIASDSDVIFSDDFESWTEDGTQPPPGKWSVRKNKISLTHLVQGNVPARGLSGPGENVLRIACWTQGKGSQAGGLSLKLGNYNHANEGLGDGYEDLYIRYYIKFGDNYHAVRNHGANLGGRDVTRSDAAWVGMAGIRDVSTRGYFYSGVQPRGKSPSRELEMGFYSYHLDKKGPWGENYDVKERIVITPGVWHCIERHMKLNSVDPGKNDGNFDGIEELWVDGKLTIRREGVRFRRVRHLRITYFSLEAYYHGLPQEYSRDNPIEVYFDNVVIARKYIGPLGEQTLQSRQEFVKTPCRAADAGHATRHNRRGHKQQETAGRPPPTGRDA